MSAELSWWKFERQNEGLLVKLLHHEGESAATEPPVQKV
jgi:hypothetical protein